MHSVPQTQISVSNAAVQRPLTIRGRTSVANSMFGLRLSQRCKNLRMVSAFALATERSSARGGHLAELTINII